MPGSGNRSGGAAVRTAPAATRGAAPLPAGVEVVRMGSGSIYRFNVAGQNVSFVVDGFTSKAGEVLFSVGGQLDRGGLTGRDADRAALTIMRIFKHDVSTRPDGYVYTTTAWTADGFGAKRAAAYERAGFSAPASGRAGGQQLGIVKGGKLTPAKATDPEVSQALRY